MPKIAKPKATRAQKALFQNWMHQKPANSSVKSDDKDSVSSVKLETLVAATSSAEPESPSVSPSSVPIKPESPAASTSSVKLQSSTDCAPSAPSTAPPRVFKSVAITDSAHQRAIDIIHELKEWQAGLSFDKEEVISLFALERELENIEMRDSVGDTAAFEGDDNKNDLEWNLFPQNPSLPQILQPLGVKVHVHDDIYMVIGVTRKSTRPIKLLYDAEVAKGYERAGKYIRFYMARCHPLVGSDSCCKPREESVVIIASSNTNFETSNENGIKDLRDLINQVEPGKKIVIACSQSDGLCTNMVGLEGFLRPFLSRGIEIELMVWWSNSEFYLYDLRVLMSQYNRKKDGLAVDSHYEKLLKSMANVAMNKEGLAENSRANKAEGLGFRNSRPIDPEDDSPEREKVEISMTAEGKQQRHLEGLRNASRAVAEITLTKNEHGLFNSPIDSETFSTINDVVAHVLKAVMTLPSGDRKCPFCESTFPSPQAASRAKKHIKRHIFDKIQCPDSESDCKYWAKTEDDLDSHIKHVHRKEEIIDRDRGFKCPICGEGFTMQYHLGRHLTNHNSSSVECDACGATLKNPAGLQDHKNRACPALPKSEVWCSLCEKWIWAKQYSRHLKIHERSDQVNAFGEIMDVDE